MLGRILSLRLQLLGAMLGTACVGLAAAYIVIGRIEHAEERSIVRRKAAVAATALAEQAKRGASAQLFQAEQKVLGDDQLIVERRGRRVFAGPARKSDLTATVERKFPGGRVIVVGNARENARASQELTLVAAAVILLVIGSASLIATLISRTVREPLRRAIAAADQVAAGNFDARMGTGGPEEFARLGHAFDQMAQRLEDVDKAQRRFLADVAHEIATPINAIIGFAGGLLDGSIATPAEREEAATVIAHESDRLDTLIADLRRLTGLDLAETVRTERIDVGQLCRDLERRFSVAARAAGLTLRAKPVLASIVSDRRLLETVLVNLLTNAIRYTPAGGTVELSGRRMRQDLVLAVRDTGIGIATDHQPWIFDRLYRVDEARDRASGGSGIGLAIAQRAARALGGRIELESELGVGSDFRLVLPRAGGTEPTES